MRRISLPIPFRDVGASVAVGSVAFLKFRDEAGGGLQGAAFVVNGLGEPLEFTFARVDVRGSSLWRAGDARRSAVGQLVRVLFPALSSRPDCLLMRADEVPPRLFLDEILLELPACRVGADTSVHAADEVIEKVDDVMHLYWIGPPPGPGERARGLVETLRARDLLAEPFERAVHGLDEAFDDVTHVVE
jgi:hypothetical protein